MSQAGPAGDQGVPVPTIQAVPVVSGVPVVQGIPVIPGVPTVQLTTMGGVPVAVPPQLYLHDSRYSVSHSHGGEGSVTHYTPTNQCMEES